jgi:hypothetical protein
MVVNKAEHDGAEWAETSWTSGVFWVGELIGPGQIKAFPRGEEGSTVRNVYLLACASPASETGCFKIVAKLTHDGHTPPSV